MKKKTKQHILRIIHKEKTDDVIGKKPLNEGEFKRDETALSKAINKYFNKAKVVMSTSLTTN